MIWYLEWKILYSENNNILIKLNSWIAYEVIINELTYSKILDKEKIEIFIYHSINENNQTLFWFLEIEEKNIFKELIKISWIWWKVAINILSLWLQNFLEAIKNEDNKTIESIKWVWKKMASKIILEFKDKDFIKNISTKKEENISNNKIEKSIKNQVLDSLINMWYNKKNIEEILEKLPENLENIEDIIPFVIKNIS